MTTTRRGETRSIGKQYLFLVSLVNVVAAVVKLVMTWDIREGKAEEYVEFAMSELVPALAKLGLSLSDAWYTMIGAGPQIIVAGWMPSPSDVHRLLISNEFEALKERLLQYVENYAWRVMAPHKGDLPFW